MELEPIQQLLVDKPLFMQNEELMQKQLAFNEEIREDRKHIRTRLEELRAQKFEMLKKRNEELIR